MTLRHRGASLVTRHGLDGRLSRDAAASDILRLTGRACAQQGSTGRLSEKGVLFLLHRRRSVEALIHDFLARLLERFGGRSLKSGSHFLISRTKRVRVCGQTFAGVGHGSEDLMVRQTVRAALRRLVAAAAAYAFGWDGNWGIRSVEGGTVDARMRVGRILMTGTLTADVFVGNGHLLTFNFSVSFFFLR